MLSYPSDPKRIVPRASGAALRCCPVRSASLRAVLHLCCALLCVCAEMTARQILENIDKLDHTPKLNLE
jgi:hypothetical protein